MAVALHTYMYIMLGQMPLCVMLHRSFGMGVISLVDTKFKNARWEQKELYVASRMD
jgi:hypothetical protein